MSKLELMNKATRAWNKGLFKVKKHSPEILVVSGAVGVVVSGVLACKATLKVHEITDQAKADIDAIHEATEKGATAAGQDYSVEDSKRDLTIVYAQTGVKLFKLYAPAVVLGTLSLGALITSNNILRKRNAVLAGAYAALDKGFKEYRGRVAERFGEAVEKEIRYNIKAQEVEEKVVNEDGTETTVKKVVDMVDEDTIAQYSPLARFYDDGCLGWTKSPEQNLIFLKQREAEATEILQRKGILFLNDVYAMLGMQKTAMGQQYGWIYDLDYPNGDNYVDFGLTDTNKRKVRDFVNGYERTVLLDFNVDGYILDRM